MSAFRDKYLSEKEGESLLILDLGSQNIGGSYRDFFSTKNWVYKGVDLVPGDNVDIVLANPYHWLELASQSADVLVSGQAFEHIEFFWLTMEEIARVLKPGGLCCIVAPSSGPEHRYPVDCWRFYPDGFHALAKHVGFEVQDVFTCWNEDRYSDGSNQWKDTVLIAKKPDNINSNKLPYKDNPDILTEFATDERSIESGVLASQDTIDASDELSQLRHDGLNLRKKLQQAEVDIRALRTEFQSLEVESQDSKAFKDAIVASNFWKMRKKLLPIKEWFSGKLS